MDSLNLNQHISAQFNEDLEHLRTKLLEMGGLVEDQLKDAVKAIETADGALAEKVIETEKEVDQREIALDQESITLLARRQPAASDLRLVMMVTKATRDLERIGDEANKIAKMAIALNSEGAEGGRGYVELRHLAASVIRLVSRVLDAFARYDVDAAMDVVREDSNVDADYKSAVREMITYMMEDPRVISRVMNIMWALRALERIGDHARNVAEQVIYLVHGTDIRHTPLGEIEKALDVKNT
ncbi:phosphate signaling complex protein PhoU [Agaribacterium sp. ZY112]|uniref:phosphate signaling complex protein PhoU n=1 Tax=Agaribacterium sp. ZY112 TaxID=3233574 RepID=UPI0035235F3E